MGPSSLTCPLCCGEKFACRASLRDHINQVSQDLRCPACLENLPSLFELVQHLGAEECSRYSPARSENLPDPLLERPDEIEQPGKQSEQDLKIFVKMEPEQHDSQPRQISFMNNEHNSLNVIEDSENHILIVGGDSTSLLSNQSIITTQNEDGTISFTPVEPEETECVEEERLSPVEEESEGEVYSCNTCGVSFTSVLQHIQKYHSEQDVVVEVAEPESDSLGEELQTNAVGAKRIITTTGNIIVESQYEQHATHKPEKEDPQTVMEEQVVDKSGRTYTRRLIKIDKFWNDEVDLESTDKIILDNKHAQIFSCPKCFVKTLTIEGLQNHNCKPPGIYCCSQCPVTYTNPKSLCAHMKVHKSSSNKLADQVVSTEAKKASGEPALMSFKCAVCDTVFPSNKSLRLHRRMHEPVKSRPMEGPVEYVSGGADAAGGESATPDTYHCTVCDKWIHMGYRDIHNNYHHSSVQYHCEICNRKFLSHDYLVMHMNVHNMEKTNVAKSDKVLPYSCLYCNRQFARPHEKVKHERIHTGEKPHTCEICGKAFRVSYCLTLHMRTHTGARPYECRHCGKRFKAHSVYNHHLLTHSDVRAYKCPYCPKAFKTSVQLAGHKNSHTKPFSCTHCNRPFASLYAVRVHTETHRRQNNLKFSCKLCGASYARAFALKDHVRSVHGTAQDTVEYVVPEQFESLPKKEDNLEVEELGNSAEDSEIIMM